MKLGFALLADFAEVTAEGKLTILGGDIDAIFSTSYPAVHERLTLVIKLYFDRAETGRSHALRLEIMHPQDTPLIEPVVIPFVPQIPESEYTDTPQQIKYVLVLGFPQLFFPSDGKYSIRLFIDEEHVDDLPLYARLIPATASPESERHEQVASRGEVSP